MKSKLQLLFFSLILPLYAMASEYSHTWTDRDSTIVDRVEDVIDPHRANRYDYVSDMAHVMSQAQEDSINILASKLEKDAEIELLVITVHSIGDNEPFDFALNLYNHIGIGKKETDRGLLIFVAVRDHHWQIITGYGAEADFPDAICSIIGRNYMVPEFKLNKYGDGLVNAVSYIYELATDPARMESVKEAIEREKAEKEKARIAEDMQSNWVLIGFWIMIASIVCWVKHTSKKTEQNKSKGLELYTSKKSVENNLVEIKEKDPKDIDYWNGKSKLRCIIYFIFPALATGAYMQLEGDPELMTEGVLASNTWVCLFYYLARLKYINTYAKDKYEQKVLLKKGVFTGKSFLATCLAPWVGIPALLLFLPKYLSVRKETMACPICGGKLTKHPDKNAFLNGLQIKENEINSKSYYSCTCENGHNVVIEESYSNSNYTTCPACKGHTMKKISEKTTVMATYSNSGSKTITYKCQYCQKIEEKVEIIPKLEHSSSSGGSGHSSSGRSSGGGGSYGGGRSGGGGAGGRW